MVDSAQEPLFVTQLAREVIRKPECERLLESIEVHYRPVEGPSITEPQRSHLANLPRNWTGSTIELALRLELCRPGANFGHPLSLEMALAFLLEDELENSQDAHDVHQELATEFSQKRTPIGSKPSAYFEHDELFIPTDVMRAIGKASGLAQRRFSFIDQDIESEAFEQIKWAESLNGFHTSLFNAAVWVAEKQLAQLGSRVTDAHIRIDSYHTQKVSSGEYDLATERQLLDLKCAQTHEFRPEWRLQLLMYWRMGLQTTELQGNARKRKFERFRELGVINPFWGRYSYMRVDDIPKDVIEYIDDVVFEFTRPVVIGERVAHAITDIGEEEISGLDKAIPVVRRREEIAFPLDVATGRLKVPDFEVSGASPNLAFQPHEIVLNWFSYDSVEDAAKAISLLCAARDVLQETNPDAVAVTGAVYANAIPQLMRVFALARTMTAAAAVAETPSEVALAAEVAGRAQRLFNARNKPLVVSHDYNVATELGAEIPARPDRSNSSTSPTAAG